MTWAILCSHETFKEWEGWKCVQSYINRINNEAWMPFGVLKCLFDNKEGISNYSTDTPSRGTDRQTEAHIYKSRKWKKNPGILK
jgi:hypothetical protein